MKPSEPQWFQVCSGTGPSVDFSVQLSLERNIVLQSVMQIRSQSQQQSLTMIVRAETD